MRRQARSHKERQARRASRLRGARLLLAALALLGAGAYGMHRALDPATFPVRTLRLSGELAHVQGEQVRLIALSHAAGGFLRVNVDAMRVQVGALPWVREAAVRRVWPDVIEVEVREHRALAQWHDDALVSEDGHLFTPPREEWPQGLSRLSGPDGSTPSVAQRYRELREILAPIGLAAASLNLSERRALELRLDNGLVVLLGRDDPQARLERFVRAYAKALAGRAADIAQVDLRYANGFAVAWKKADPTA